MLLIAVTDNEVMYISVDKIYRNLSIRDSQLRDADRKNATERTNPFIPKMYVDNENFSS